MAVLKVILICLEVALLFNFIILVHELGHFLAARWRGLVVDRFSIWFGKPIWQRKIGSVTYSLGSIPAGGFVSLPQLAPMEWIEGKVLENGEPLRPARPLDKIIVAAAGPLFSLSLAVAFACVVWVIGRPVSEAEVTTVIGYVVKDSPAERSGLRPGDRIVAIDNHPVERFNGLGNSVLWQVAASEGRTLRVEYERDGQRLVAEPEPTKDPVKAWQRENLRQIKIYPAESPMVGEVKPNSPAARAGLRPNDILVGVDGHPLFHRQGLSDHITAKGTKPVTLDVKRDGKTFQVTVTPEVPVSGAIDKQPLIGVRWDETGVLTMVHPSPWEQITGVMGNMVNTLGALISPRSDIKPQHLNGPVGIMRIYYLVFDNEHAWRQAFWFSVLLNVNLGLMNLLPVPMLDGGHIVLSLAEAVRRRPLSEPVVRWVQTAGAMLVIGFILYVTTFDFMDLRGGHGAPARQAAEEVRFGAPPTAPAGGKATGTP
jgi:regulator of sigma E protease